MEYDTLQPNIPTQRKAISFRILVMHQQIMEIAIVNHIQRITVVTVGIIVAAALGFAFVPAQAQSPDCWREVERGTTQIINPLTRTIVEVPRIVEVFDEDCRSINDGRVNNLDSAAEAAVYCNGGNIDVYDLDWSGNGTFVFRVTPAELNRVPANPQENTLIEGAPGFALYRLTSGEIQLNGPADWEGKPYVFIWNGC